MADDLRRAGVRTAGGALGLAALLLASAATAPPARTALDLTGVVLLVAPALLTAARRWLPVPVLAGTVGCLVAYQALGYPGFAAALPVMVALFAAVTAGLRRVAGAAIGVVLVGGFAGEVLGAGQAAAPGIFQHWFLLIGWMVASCCIAELFRRRRADVAHAEQRAADAERTREDTARRRADQERLRIARELHDALTHSISIVNVQAGVAVHLARKQHLPVPDALVTIQKASQEAMRELRATLKVLRADGDRTGASLARLDDLVQIVRESGVPVTLTVTGTPQPLPAPVDQAAYRILQEALTNVTRHAGPATAAVSVHYQAGAVAVHVDDDGIGAGPADVVPGLGLTGMRERVAALGGTLRAGSGSGRGFSVAATLPLAAA